MPSHKKCKTCGAERPSTYFDRSAESADGLTTKCKDCRRAYNRAAYYRKRDGLPGLRPPPPVTGQPKACRDCGEVKQPEQFPRKPRAADGRGIYCNPCHNARSMRSRDKVGGSRNYHLQRRYGITAAQVDEMIAEQGGLCALCRERPAEHVDHDHVTGRVRGVLCFCCNQGLGNFRDRADILRIAIDYLEKTTWQRTRVCTGVYRLTSPHPAPPRSASSSA